jgi:hypothetical protein
MSAGRLILALIASAHLGLNYVARRDPTTRRDWLPRIDLRSDALRALGR